MDRYSIKILIEWGLNKNNFKGNKVYRKEREVCEYRRVELIEN